jgi:hypothetical protein
MNNIFSEFNIEDLITISDNENFKYHNELIDYLNSLQYGGADVINRHNNGYEYSFLVNIKLFNFNEQNEIQYYNIESNQLIKLIKNWYRDNIFDGNDDILYGAFDIHINNFNINHIENNQFEISLVLNKDLNEEEEDYVKMIISNIDSNMSHPLTYLNTDYYIGV